MISFPILTKLFMHESTTDKWLPIGIGNLELEETPDQILKTTKISKTKYHRTQDNLPSLNAVIQKRHSSENLLSTRLDKNSKIEKLDSTLISFTAIKTHIVPVTDVSSPDNNLNVDLAISFLNEETRDKMLLHIQSHLTKKDVMLSQLKDLVGNFTYKKVHKYPKDQDHLLLSILHASILDKPLLHMFSLKGDLVGGDNDDSETQPSCVVPFDRKAFAAALFRVSPRTLLKLISFTDTPNDVLILVSKCMDIDLVSIYNHSIISQNWYPSVSAEYRKILLSKLVFTSLRAAWVNNSAMNPQRKKRYNEEVRNINHTLLDELLVNDCEQLNNFRRFGDLAISLGHLDDICAYYKLLEKIVFLVSSALTISQKRTFVDQLDVHREFGRIAATLELFTSEEVTDASSIGSTLSNLPRKLLKSTDGKASPLPFKHKEEVSVEDIPKSQPTESVNSFYNVVLALLEFLEVLTKLVNSDTLTAILQDNHRAKGGKFLAGEKIYQSSQSSESSSVTSSNEPKGEKGNTDFLLTLMNILFNTHITLCFPLSWTTYTSPCSSR